MKYDNQKKIKYSITQDSINCVRVITQEKTIDFVPIDKIKEWNKTFEPKHLIECIKLESDDGETHFVQKDLATKWLKIFKLADINDDFIPKIQKEIKPFLENLDIHLKIGSLLKLNERDRAEFIHSIKPTLESADALMRQNDGALIFIKNFGEHKKYFASVSKNKFNEWVVTSNAPKTLNNINNKLEDGGKMLYSNLPEFPIIAKPELSAKALNGEANCNIIPQSKAESQGKNPKVKPKSQSNDFGMNM